MFVYIVYLTYIWLLLDSNVQRRVVGNLLGVTSVRCATEVTAVVTFNKDVAIVSTMFKVRCLMEPLVPALVLRHTPY